jgi:hypothetical protein
MEDEPTSISFERPAAIEAPKELPDKSAQKMTKNFRKIFPWSS